jgi:fumarylpyruvate hydrolase
VTAPTYVFPPPQLPAVPVVGGGLFPVHRIYCVGRNYAAHALEMGFEPDREAPFFFLKPADAIVHSGSAVRYPPMTADYHHEVELVVAIGQRGRDISVSEARKHVFGYAVGLDMTRRDLQIGARKQGRPWDMGKAFDQSAPCGPIMPDDARDIERASIRLEVNGQVRQRAALSSLIWNIQEIIHWLSRYVELMPGDLIYTGTPEGVGPVVQGDRLVGSIEGLQDLVVTVHSET